MAALALADRPQIGARVPAEYIGLARQLVQRVSAFDAASVVAYERVLGAYRPSPGWRPMPSLKLLRALPAKLRTLGRGPARLRLVSSFDPATGRLQIAELRLSPSTITAPGWAEDEIALAISLRGIVIAPPDFRENHVAIAGIGLHALSRRFERGGRDPAGVLADLLALAEGWRDAIRGGSAEIEIPVPGGGRWIGARGPDDAVAVVRTFIDKA